MTSDDERMTTWEAVGTALGMGLILLALIGLAVFA